MNPTYSIGSNPMLSDKANLLLMENIDVFDAVTVSSERILGLHGSSFTGSDAEDAKLAVVYQLNYELEQDTESSVYKKQKQDKRSWEFRDDLEAIAPKAKAIADRLLSSISTNRQSATVSVATDQNIW